MENVGGDTMRFCERCGRRITGSQYCTCVQDDIQSKLLYEFKYVRNAASEDTRQGF